MLAGCSRGCPGSRDLLAQGETPYERCLAASAPAAASWRVGPLKLSLEGRELTISGLEPVVRIAAFAGAGFEPPSGVPGLAASKVDLAFMLGGLGDTPALARSSVRWLSALPFPTLFVAGGRDSRARINGALTRPGKVVDVTAVRSVRFGSDTWLPIAGSFRGREALAGGCGYDLEDLEAVSSELAELPGRRWLLAPEAAGGSGRAAVARTEAGVDLGSAALARFAGRAKAAGGVFSWPHVQLLRPAVRGGAARAGFGAAEPFASDLRVVVPRLWGAAMERSDGSRVAPGYALLELGPTGLRALDAASAGSPEAL